MPRDTSELFGSRLRVIAHRGGIERTPENTLAAFASAAAAGFDIELDARRCRTGELVVIHDPTLERTTDGTGLVAERSLAELRTLDAGAWYGPDHTGEPVPTLEEVLRRFARMVRLTIEVKTEATAPGELAELAAEIVATLGRTDTLAEVVVGSFQPAIVAALARLEPAVRRAQIFDRPPAIDPAAAPDVTMPGRDLVDRGLVTRLHDDGYRIHVWTVNEPTEVKRMVALGVDGIITDEPFAVRELLALADGEGST